MREQSLDTIAQFMQQKAGIRFTASKTYMIEARLEAVIKRFGFADIDTLAIRLPQASGEVQQALVDALTTNESFFFFAIRSLLRHLNRFCCRRLLAALRMRAAPFGFGVLQRRRARNPIA